MDMKAVNKVEVTNETKKTLEQVNDTIQDAIRDGISDAIDTVKNDLQSIKSTLDNIGGLENSELMQKVTLQTKILGDISSEIKTAKHEVEMLDPRILSISKQIQSAKEKSTGESKGICEEINHHKNLIDESFATNKKEVEKGSKQLLDKINNNQNLINESFTDSKIQFEKEAMRLHETIDYNFAAMHKELEYIKEWISQTDLKFINEFNASAVRFDTLKESLAQQRKMQNKQNRLVTANLIISVLILVAVIVLVIIFQI